MKAPDLPASAAPRRPLLESLDILGALRLADTVTTLADGKRQRLKPKPTAAARMAVGPLIRLRNRDGGEKFPPVIVNSLANNTPEVAQKIRETVRGTPAESEGNSISMSLAYFDPVPPVASAEVARLAGGAGFRRAKEIGRDCIFSHLENGA